MRPTTTVAVRHPESNQFVTLDPRQDYEPDDLLVREYPWAFTPTEPPRVVESVRIEQATAAPGEKRARRTSR